MNSYSRGGTIRGQAHPALQDAAAQGRKAGQKEAYWIFRVLAPQHFAAFWLPLEDVIKIRETALEQDAWRLRDIQILDRRRQPDEGDVPAAPLWLGTVRRVRDA